MLHHYRLPIPTILLFLSCLRDEAEMQGGTRRVLSAGGGGLAVALLVERGVSPQKAAQHAGAVSVHSCAHLIDKSFGAVVFNT